MNPCSRLHLCMQCFKSRTCNFLPCLPIGLLAASRLFFLRVSGFSRRVQKGFHLAVYNSKSPFPVLQTNAWTQTLTLTNSMTRKSSSWVSKSSIRRMMFGCWTMRRMDTSFSIIFSFKSKKTPFELQNAFDNMVEVCEVKFSGTLRSIS